MASHNPQYVHRIVLTYMPNKQKYIQIHGLAFSSNKFVTPCLGFPEQRLIITFMITVHQKTLKNISKTFKQIWSVV